MRDYGKVSPQFWTGRTGRAIRAAGPDAQIVALYLMTAPGASMTGLYYLPVQTIAYETGLPLQGASKGLASLSEVGFAEYDAENEVVWVREMAAHQIAEVIKTTDNRHIAIVKESQKLAYSSVYARWFARYREPYSLPEAKPLASPFKAPSKPLLSQEQDQEQDQEQGQEQKQDSPERAEHAAATAPVQPSPTVKPPKPRTPTPPPAMELPPTDPKARAVYDAILADPVLARITARPADLATRMVAPGAYPGVNVLSQVLRAAAFVAGGKRSYRDGRAFLLGWMGRADIEPVAPTGGGAPQPDRFGRVPVVSIQPPVVRRGDLAVDRPAMVPGSPEARATSAELQKRLDAMRLAAAGMR
jgi:hypothetical protein